MEELLSQIAADTGVPTDLLERAARARATAQGVDVDALVSGWAGGEAPTPAVATEPAPEPAAEPAPAAASGAGKLPEALVRRSAAAKAKREGRPLDEVLAEMGLSPEGATAEAPAAEPAGAPAAAVPAASPDQPAAEDEVVEEEEPQPVFAGFPRWLAASFIIIPMIALLYAGLAPNGPDCGTSGQLAINPVSGEAQSCGGDASPFFSLGEAVYDAQCVACHGADGSGGVGPSFLGGAVLQTFSACTDHIEWVAFGTNDFPGATYGDTAKPVGGGGVMPGYQNSLTEQEIAAVALYERVAFGGEDLIVGEQGCGLVEAPAE